MMKFKGTLGFIATTPDLPVSSKTKLTEWAQESRCFVFADSPEKNKLASDFNPFSLKEAPLLDLPFPMCSFESTGKDPLFLIRFDKAGIKPVHCVVVKELEPRKYIFLLAFDQDFSISSADPDLPYALQAYLKTIPEQSLCIEKVNERVKVRIAGANHLTKIKEVIHVTPKKMTALVGPNGGRIDYSHRFEVRGHWRQIERIGKDREGNYCVKGYTWVIPSVKGPEDKPLIRKQRVIHNTEVSNDRLI